MGLLMVAAVVFPASASFAGGRDAASWLSWTALQAIPSPTFTFDNGRGNHQLVTSFRWQVTPLSYSWSANELVSSVSIFMVNPVRRLAGSAELFVQPEVAFTDYPNAGLGRSSLGIGSRAFFPVDECGEYLSVSLGGKYVMRKSLSGAGVDTYAGEIGVYTLFGLVGMQLSIGNDPAARFSFSLYLKYY
jgi:hypothetical protein